MPYTQYRYIKFKKFFMYLLATLNAHSMRADNNDTTHHFFDPYNHIAEYQPAQNQKMDITFIPELRINNEEIICRYLIEDKASKMPVLCLFDLSLKLLKKNLEITPANNEIRELNQTFGKNINDFKKMLEDAYKDKKQDKRELNTAVHNACLKITECYARIFFNIIRRTGRFFDGFSVLEAQVNNIPAITKEIISTFVLSAIVPIKIEDAKQIVKTNIQQQEKLSSFIEDVCNFFFKTKAPEENQQEYYFNFLAILAKMFEEKYTIDYFNAVSKAVPSNNKSTLGYKSQEYERALTMSFKNATIDSNKMVKVLPIDVEDIMSRVKSEQDPHQSYNLMTFLKKIIEHYYTVIVLQDKKKRTVVLDKNFIEQAVKILMLFAENQNNKPKELTHVLLPVTFDSSREMLGVLMLVCYTTLTLKKPNATINYDNIAEIKMTMPSNVFFSTNINNGTNEKDNKVYLPGLFEPLQSDLPFSVNVSVGDIDCGPIIKKMPSIFTKATESKMRVPYLFLSIPVTYLTQEYRDRIKKTASKVITLEVDCKHFNTFKSNGINPLAEEMEKQLSLGLKLILQMPIANFSFANVESHNITPLYFLIADAMKKQETKENENSATARFVKFTFFYLEMNSSQMLESVSSLIKLILMFVKWKMEAPSNVKSDFCIIAEISCDDPKIIEILQKQIDQKKLSKLSQNNQCNSNVIFVVKPHMCSSEEKQASVHYDLFSEKNISVEMNSFLLQEKAKVK